MSRKHFISYAPICLAFLLLGSQAIAHDADLGGPNTHRNVPATITKIESGLMYLDIQGTSGKKVAPRWVSVKKAERMGLHEAKVGDEVTVTVDESNVLLDIHDPSRPIHRHRVVVGKLAYADPFWEVVEIYTGEGLESYSVDSLAGTKLGALKEGALVRAELDEANVMIDIHPYHRQREQAGSSRNTQPRAHASR
ncbi:MAG: hypothetical protein P0119_18705 [Nitrospira sp.]|nr:hypothetical protein [Nitrospira sp.]